VSSAHDREVLDTMTRALARTLLERVGARFQLPSIGVPEPMAESPGPAAG
jgi:hypothetical protein